jgi:hypothetical protein
MSCTPRVVLIGVATMLTVACTCSLFAPSAPNAQSPASIFPATDTQAAPLDTAIPSNAALPLAPSVNTIAAPALAPVPSDTALPAFTATAKPIPSDTAVPALTPAATSNFTAAGAIPTADATQFALFGPMADLMVISQYYNPVGTPLQSWHGVPIMSQATAGQEFKSDVYSYKATATLSQAAQYYSAKAPSIGLPPGPAGTGHAGTGAMANHNTTFYSRTLGIVITSMDNDPQHVIVIIAKAP